MTKTRHLIASAPIAIAAMAALSATPSMSQETPVIVLDVPTPVATSQPVITIPEVAPTSTPETIEAAPVEPVAATGTPIAEPAPEPAPARTKATSSYTPAEAVAPAAATAQPSPDAVPIDPVETDSALPVAGADELPIAQAELAPVPEPIRDISSAALLFGLLAAGGVGLAAFFLLRSRHRKVAEVPVIEKPVVARQVSPIEREPVVTSHDEAPIMAAAPVDPGRPLEPSNGAAVELPPVAPTSEAERGRLISRMIAARPDRANPFQSHKARAKRARLILQSIGTRFTDRKPGIDLSQYTNVWPELRGWRPATA
ncbi:MAG: hypothetical protein R3E14_01825 [Erythrobacter sp.]